MDNHYKHSFTTKITMEDKDRGTVTVKMDPYRVCEIYDIGGGPREHAIKKLLRGEGKGHTLEEVIAEVRLCLDRWEEMIHENA